MKEVLLVDDELEIQILVADFLRNYGVKVEAYANGQQAAKRLQVRSYDLIITDLRMPEEDGFSVIYKARNQWRDSAKTPIIVITGATKSDNFDFSIENLPKNNIQVLRKPFELDELLAMVCTAFGIDVADADSLLSVE